MGDVKVTYKFAEKKAEEKVRCPYDQIPCESCENWDSLGPAAMINGIHLGYCAKSDERIVKKGICDCFKVKKRAKKGN